MPIKLNSSGGGSVTIDVPSTGSAYTLTVPAVTANIITSADSATVNQTMMASGVTTTGPAFYAYVGTTTTTVNNNSFTKLGLNTELFDTANCFDSTTNFRFTPNVAGYYQFNASVTVPSAISQIMQFSIYKNGAEALRIGQSQSTWWTLCGSGMLYMNGTTDYVELYFYQLSGGAVSIGNLGSAMNYMSGFLARAA